MSSLLAFSAGNATDCLPFVAEGHHVGFVRWDVLKTLKDFPNVFTFHSHCVELNQNLKTYEERSWRMAETLEVMRQKYNFPALRGWRNEVCMGLLAPINFPIVAVVKNHKLLCLVFSGLFGIRQYGVDINGYVNDPDLGFCMWLQQRSFTKPTWPGRWDSMAAGGLTSGQGILESVCKEAAEEASIPSHILNASLRPSGSVSFFYEDERGLFPQTEFVYDLELPLDFMPVNADGEVECFQLFPLHEILEKIHSSDFKTTSCPVVVDFLVRHGVITSENQPDLPQLVEMLHSPVHVLFDSISHGKELQVQVVEENSASLSPSPLVVTTCNSTESGNHA
ncbi:unnamed protein product [Darwinula stevensoni]|uniref:Nudix hydrolase domain-containing protein n=1 Tax=Darwinula stevensoni TaxID=69355 RepID=A0A7R9A5S8_9CRUS|nr:unnamed protein product [Darwinula stevensoni]CAG0896093.1 unnamed protein product [Darwinula stevensoni]